MLVMGAGNVMIGLGLLLFGKRDAVTQDSGE